VQALVRRGLGVAVVPRLLLDGPDATLATIPVDHLVPDRVIALTTRSNGARPPAVEFAVAIMRAQGVA
jgi:DNA-binding transcriptional LysR family regulator